jgi:hypothetical protein
VAARSDETGKAWMALKRFRGNFCDRIALRIIVVAGVTANGKATTNHG